MKPRPFVVALVVGILLGSAAVLAAPQAKKPKDTPAGPITDEQLRATVQNLKHIGLAWHNYHDNIGHFPSNEMDKAGKALLSWRVQILPYIEEEGLYKQFKLDEPWDSEHNKKLIDKMPKLYAPVRRKPETGMTYYQSFAGKRGMLRPGERVTLASITDGTSNTLMVAEAAKPVIWTKPDDLPYDGTKAPELGGMFDGKFHAAYCDGSVRRFRRGVDREVLKLLIDPQDGQVIPADVGIDDEDKK